VYLCQHYSHSVLPSASYLPICLDLPRPALEPGSALVLGNPTGDLPGAEREAALVAERFGVRPLLREAATRDSLLQAGDALGLLHVAAHGVYEELDPLLSGIELADGRATADDLVNGQLRCGLLVLSGCLTAMGQRGPGDELIGLSRAASFAGVPSVLTTLWPTYDQSSVAFFDRFYGALLAGHDKSEATRRAQLGLLASDAHRRPVHWAPFIVAGDWR
jgi:CHAT domain-containing protein